MKRENGSFNRVAAVDADELAGDPARLFGSEEDNHMETARHGARRSLDQAASGRLFLRANAAQKICVRCLRGTQAKQS